MTTYTWDNDGDWTAPTWAIGTSTVVGGPPGPGDTANIILGTVDLEIPLYDMQVAMLPVQEGTAEIVATNVELGDNLVLTGDSAGSSIFYEVVGTGTLDDGHRTDGLAPKAGAIVSNVLNFVLSAGGGSDTPIFINDGSISGDLAISVAAGTTSATFENDSTIAASAVAIRAGVTLDGTGVIDVAGGAGIEGAVGSGQTFEVTNSLSADFTIFDPAAFQGEVVLAQTDAIFLEGVDSGEKSYANGVLTLDNGYTLRVTPGENANSFIVLAGTGQTDVYAIEVNPCFAAGTRIATPGGAVAVEALRPGDHVRLATGGSADIRWVGHRRVRCDRHPRPHEVFPVRIRADAFAPGQPARDLLLSPDHAVFAGGVLIPVRCLLNGTTIAQEPATEITYHHVELQRHGVLLAEGLPAESFLDTGNRGAFANGGAVVHMHPDFPLRTWDGSACAPLIVAGPALQAVRAQLLQRATKLARRPPKAGRARRA
jgi:hypothetical protein